ncbi:MAG: hypothetical protein JW750_09695, partial [Anaerolineaceae bacterium]|nr:hypothetical protein [Anaerolineaceae bacterium]
MLGKILKEIESADGVISLEQLSQKMGVQSSALEGMIEMLIQRGKLEVVDSQADDCESGDCCGSKPSACASCGTGGECPFLLRYPKT